MSVNFDLSSTKTWATGDITANVDFFIKSATYAFNGSSTVTGASTLQIDQPVLAGTNATITNSAMITLGLGSTNTSVSNAGSSYGILISVTGISNSFGTATTRGGIYLTGPFGGGSLSLGDQTATLTTFAPIIIDAITLASTTNTRTVTNAYGLSVAAPVAGTNVSFTNQSLAINAVGGVLIAPTALTAGTPYSLTITPPSNTGLTLSMEVSQFVLSASTQTWATGSLSLQRYAHIGSMTIAAAGASVVTQATAIGADAPQAGTNVTITNTAIFRGGASNPNIGPTSAAMQYAVFDAAAHTVTVTGTTEVTSAASFSMAHLHQLTITDASSVTIDQAQALYIKGAPVAAGSVTITNPYAIYVAGGNSLFVGGIASQASTVTLGVGATAIPITSNTVTVTGDAGGNTIATMTGGLSGQVVTLIFADANVTITNNGASLSANQFDLSASFTSALHKSLTVVKAAAGYWVETARSSNT
ncbi:MAG: hypothetical protein KGL39_43945 [Patescibacteria group bacterium]|nr:hypothetical protein [Patescibacteria group bacterium]